MDTVCRARDMYIADPTQRYRRHQYCNTPMHLYIKVRLERDDRIAFRCQCHIVSQGLRDWAPLSPSKVEGPAMLLQIIYPPTTAWSTRRHSSYAPSPH